MSPLARLSTWLEEARAAGEPEPDAMALATVDVRGGPVVRVVLCRGVDERGVRFFTNYESRKGLELAGDPRASVVFHWDLLKKQVRVEGRAQKLTPAESDAYFAGRPRGSQISAIISPQSRPIESLEHLRERWIELDRALANKKVERPENWGGYVLVADAVELWIAGADRMHDRLRYERRGDTWSESRLAP